MTTGLLKLNDILINRTLYVIIKNESRGIKSMNPNMNGQQPAQPNIQTGQPNVFNQPMVQPAPQPQPAVSTQQVATQQPVVQPQPATYPQQVVAPVLQPSAPPPNPQPTIITQPAVPAPVVNPVSPTVPKKTFQQQIAALDQDQVKKYAGVACGALIIISVFLPFYNVKHVGPSIPTSVSIWHSGQQISRLILILFGILPIFTFLFQKVKRLSYISAGFSLAVVIWLYDFYEGQNLSIGIWLLFLGAIGLLALNIMEDLEDIKSMFIFGTKITPLPEAPKVPGPQAVTPIPQAAPSAVVQPVMQQPVPQPMQPAVQTIPICGNCGQPRKVATDSFCQVCGQKY